MILKNALIVKWEQMKIKNKITALWNKRIVPFLKDPLFLSKWVDEYQRAREESGRITSWVNGGYKTLIGKDKYQGDLFMFVEDMHLRSIPFSRYDSIDFTAKLTPENIELERIIADSISNKDFRHGLTESLEELIREGSQMLFSHAELFYEIECEHDQEGKITKLDFHFVWPPTMKKVFGTYFQVIPWSAAKHARVKAGIRHVPKERILHITPPKELGGKRRLRKIVKRLASLSSVVMPDFQMKAMEKNKSVGFDLDLYTKRKYMEKAILTKPYGWNQRQYQDNNILEYYSIHRYLTQALAMAVVRKQFVDKLNEALNGSYINAGVSIALEGNLPTKESLLTEYKKLSEGNVKFVDLIKKHA